MRKGIGGNYNPKERVRMIKAMDVIARSINDEDVFEGWLMCGVADGDIDADTTDEDILSMYGDSETLQELMECFMRCMTSARVNGGLYCDSITTREEEIR